MEQQWIRTCQECGHEQSDAQPDRSKELTDAYRNRRCKKCKSPGLDYGMFKSRDASGDEGWDAQ